MKKFNNVENKSYQVIDENGKPKTIWASRSIAVFGFIVCIVDNHAYILLIKRSNKCPDEVGKYACVTGYLDWNETLLEALIRECYEECGLDLDYLINKSEMTYSELDQPYLIESSPQNNLQNVTARFVLIFDVDKLPKLNKSDEVDEIGWFDISESELLNGNLNKETFAWNHANIISDIKKTALNGIEL